MVETLVKPLEQLMQAESSKGYVSILTIFQVLAAAGQLSLANKVSFLDLALHMLDSSDDMIPIKVVQILLIMLTRADVARPPLATKVRTRCYCLRF